jgi:predicted NAD-dependent protein-ADP-ribosyltransferase YbiA (DUF1768 family)
MPADARQRISFFSFFLFFYIAVIFRTTSSFPSFRNFREKTFKWQAAVYHVSTKGRQSLQFQSESLKSRFIFSPIPRFPLRLPRIFCRFFVSLKNGKWKQAIVTVIVRQG